jgi:murein DD-endopeptidase MepM/ murein hydrolase activator NlpD
MAIKPSLLKNTNSIEAIQNSINAFGVSLRAANSTSSLIIRGFTESNRQKKNSIIKRRELFGKRREAVRRREKEDQIEASRVGGIFRRTAKVIGSSTKGFLGRVMDFLGTILVGWIVTNLPIIIDTVQDLIGRIQKAAAILKGWFEGTINFFTGFTSKLGDSLTKILSFDFSGQKKQVDTASDKTQQGAAEVKRDFLSLEQQLRNFNLIDYLGDFAKGVLGIKTEKDPTNNNNSNKSDPGGTPSSEGSDPIPSGGKASPEQIARIAKTAGIPEKHIPTMVSIALAESGGDIGARYNPEGNTGEDSYGLWQINMDPRYADERLKLFGIDNKKELFDPVTNAKAAYEIFKLQGFDAWTVYRTGKYRDFLPAAKKAASASTQPTISRSVDTSTRYKVNDDVTQLLGGQSQAIITSTKGMQESFRTKPHGGIDIACSAGLFISLTVDAEAVGTKSDRGYGNVIDVWVPSLGVQLRFAHNSRILISSGKIPAGTSFAITGSTGRSTGPHIHLEASSERGSTNYGGNMVPAPYVSLIRLTKAKIEGKKSTTPEMSNGSGGQSLNIEGSTRRTVVAGSVTPEKKGSVVTVPINMSSNPQTPPPQSSSGGQMTSSTKETSLNSFITKTLLKELEYV